jgi:hypothetical protein
VRRIPVNTPLVVSVVFAALAAVVVALQLPALAGALFIGRPDKDPVQVRLAGYLEAHGEDLALYRQRFDGRSLFVKPQPPRTTPPPIVRTPVEEPATPVAPPVPANYTGPDVLFVLGDEVWFYDEYASPLGVRVKVGEEGTNGVTVIASDPPWKVRLGHKGGEYDVQLFNRSYPGLSEEARGPTSERPVPGLVLAEDVKEEPQESAGEGTQKESP